VARLLRAAEDGHVYVRAGGRTIGTNVNASPPNFYFETLRKAVSDWRDHGNGVISGRVGGGELGYLVISGWDPAAEKSLDEAFAAAEKDAKGLVIDVRANGGGDEISARRFAGRFVDGPKVYSKDRIRRGGKWEGPFDRVVEPRPEAERYGGLVAVLVGPTVGSSCESFVLMMRQSPRCKLVGGVTKGSSGNPKPHDLGNGVTVFLPSWEDQMPDGTVVEGRGVMPDVEVKTTPAELRRRDAVLEAGVAAVRKVTEGSAGG
jgi:C-terminal processing protease CtpA/Prc